MTEDTYASIPAEPSRGTGEGTSDCSVATLSPAVARLIQVAQAAAPLSIDELATELGLKRHSVTEYLRRAKQAGCDVPIRRIGRTMPRHHAQLLAWLRGRPEGMCTHAEVVEAFSPIRCAPGRAGPTVTKWLTALAAKGLITCLGRRDYWRITQATEDAPRTISIRGLQALAEDATRRAINLRPTTGHRTLPEWEAITAITDAQNRDIRTALNAIARFYGLDEEVPLPVELIVWDDRAEDWPGLRPAAAHSRSSAKVLAGGRLALHLAANHGMIRRAVNSYATIAPAFLPWVDETAAAAEPQPGRRRNNLRIGLRTLSRTATGLGYQHPQHVGWGRVRDVLQAERSVTPAPPEARRREIGEAITAYNRVPALVGTGGSWSTSRLGTFLSQAAAEAHSVAATSGGEHDWSSWRLPLRSDCSETAPLRTLLDGPYGFKRWIQWATGEDGVLLEAGLPARRYPDERPPSRRGFQLGRVTVRNRLIELGRYITWLHKHGHVIAHAIDMRELVRPTLLYAYRDWRLAEGLPVDAPIRSLAMVLVPIASPYLQAVAIQQADGASANDMVERQRALKTVLRKFTPDIGEQREKHLAISRAYRTTVGAVREEGLQKLRRLRDLQLRDIEASVKLTVQRQLDLVRSGDTSWMTVGWARKVRDAFIINLMRRIPLRASEIAALGISTRSDPRKRWGTLVITPADADNHSAEHNPRTGAIGFDIPGELLKSGRRFRPSLIAIDQVGAFESEDDLCRPLLELYLHPGGARDHLCVYAGHHGSPWLLVSSDRRNSHQGKLQRRALSDVFDDAIQHYGGELGLDLARLQELHGATGLHSIRTLFAVYWVNNNRAAFAADYMQHADQSLTIQLYGAQNEQDRLPPSVTVSRSVPSVPALEGAMGQASAEAEIDALRAELLALRAQIASLQRA